MSLPCGERVTAREAFNCLTADSVLVLDCCATRAGLVPGCVALDPQLPPAEAAMAGREEAMDDLTPDNPWVAVLFDDGGDDGGGGSDGGCDCGPAGRGALVARWLLGEGHCRRVLRVARQAFAERYGFLLGTPLVEMPVYPQEIVEDSLFLGSAAAAAGRALDDLRITHVVSVVERRPPSPRGRAHLWCQVEDSTGVDLTPVMVEALTFISGALGDGGRVLVHCEQGRSRSGSVVVAHLCLHRGIGRDEALALVKAQRPIARPNERFMEQLQERPWEVLLRPREGR